MPDLSSFNYGTDQKPELSTTLIIQVSGLGWKNGRKITGPGIQRPLSLNIEGLLKILGTEKSDGKCFP